MKSKKIGNNSNHLAARVFIAIILLGLSKPAISALPLSEIEWTTWGEYCQLSYVLSGYGDTSKYAKKISRDYATQRITELHKSLRIPGAHHFCYGLLHMKRATIGAKPMKQKIAIAKSAAAEFHYSYVRLDGNDATATAFVATNYGKSLWLSGERREAHSVWNEALESGITTPLLISAKLEALIEENDSESAIATLTAWTKNNTPTAEIHYWAAMAYCRAGNYPVAAEHVSLAIGAGFPAGHLSRQIKNRECKTTRQPEIAN